MIYMHSIYLFNNSFYVKQEGGDGLLFIRSIPGPSTPNLILKSLRSLNVRPYTGVPRPGGPGNPGGADSDSG